MRPKAISGKGRCNSVLSLQAGKQPGRWIRQMMGLWDVKGVGLKDFRRPPRDLVQAASQGDIEVVARLLGTGVPPDVHDDEGWPALARAAQLGRPGVVSLLLQAGAEPEMGGDAGVPPIAAAAANGQDSCVRLLWESGAHVDSPGPGGVAPLMMAAARGFEDTVRLLVELGAEVEARNIDGQTALMYAAASLCPRTCAALLELGADPDAQDDRGDSALHYVLKQRYLPNAYRFGGTASQLLKMLLDSGADARKPDAEGAAPIQLALRARRLDLVACLNPDSQQPPLAA